MFAIFRKETTGFFSSLTGYMVIIVFLLINSLFMWVLPGEWNILDSGYAGLDTLFLLSIKHHKQLSFDFEGHWGGGA